jgi:hypothetical protein
MNRVDLASRAFQPFQPFQNLMEDYQSASVSSLSAQLGIAQQGH